MSCIINAEVRKLSEAIHAPEGDLLPKLWRFPFLAHLSTKSQKRGSFMVSE
jgi:hypothetical protein